MSVSDKHLVGQVNDYTASVPQQSGIENSEVVKVDSTAQKLLHTPDHSRSNSVSDCTQDTDTPPLSPSQTQNQIHRSQLGVAVERLEDNLAKLIALAKESKKSPIMGRVKQVPVSSSYDSKGNKIKPIRQTSRVFLFGSEDSRTSLKPSSSQPNISSTSGKKKTKAALHIDNAEVVINLKGLSERLHLPLEELILAAKENRLEEYLASKVAHIQTLSLTLSVFTQLSKAYKALSKTMDPQNIIPKEQILRVIQAAFLTPIKTDSNHVFYLGFTKGELRRAEIDADFIITPMESKILVQQKRRGKINFYHTIKTIGNGTFGTVDRVARFSAKAIQSGVLKTEIRFASVSREENSLVSEFDFHQKLQAKLGPEGLPGLQEMPKVIRSLFQDNIFALFYKEYNLGSLDKCIEKLSVEQKNEVFNQLINVFRQFYANGICHWDIKPANILIDHSEGKIAAVIGDLAGAKFKEDISDIQPHTTRYTNASDFRTRLETEKQDLDKVYEISHMHDIFSMGCTLFYLYTGIHFSDLQGVDVNRFMGLNFTELKGLHSEGKTLEQLLQKAKTPPAIAAIIMTMLQPDHEERAQWAKM